MGGKANNKGWRARSCSEGGMMEDGWMDRRRKKGGASERTRWQEKKEK